jgi:hypothetical protein
MATKKNEDLDFLSEQFIREQEIINEELTRQNDNYKKAKDFYKRNIPVHLLKRDRQWYNGTILELTNDFFILDERKLGRRVVFFLELYDIEELEEKDDRC